MDDVPGALVQAVRDICWDEIACDIRAHGSDARNLSNIPASSSDCHWPDCYCADSPTKEIATRIWESAVHAASLIVKEK
jgi:hypothetical protein